MMHVDLMAIESFLYWKYRSTLFWCLKILSILKQFHVIAYSELEQSHQFTTLDIYLFVRVFFFFKTGFICATMAVLELILFAKLALNPEICLHLKFCIKGLCLNCPPKFLVILPEDICKEQVAVPMWTV